MPDVNSNLLYEAVDKAKKYDQLTFITREKTLCCSFCQKRQEDVKKLVAGSGVYICDACIALCNEILLDEGIIDPQ